MGAGGGTIRLASQGEVLPGSRHHPTYELTLGGGWQLSEPRLGRT
jgi:hypothetical protein